MEGKRQVRTRKRADRAQTSTMEHASVLLLLLITLFATSHGELAGSWYAANVINDGDFSPKPISEIFSTESPFSTANPIVVLPSSSSTVAPPISSSVSTADFTSFSTTPSPLTSEYNGIIPLTSTQGAQSYPTRLPNFDSQFQYPFGQGVNLNANQAPPNYFMIYQQVPQTLGVQPTFPTSTPGSNYQSTYVPTSSSLSTRQPTRSTLQPGTSTPQSTWSSFQPEVSTVPPTSSSPSTWSTFQTELSRPTTTWSPAQPDVSSTPSTWSTPPPSWTTVRPDVSTLRSTLSTSRLLTSLQPSPSTTPSSPSTLRSSQTVFPCVTSTVGPIGAGPFGLPPKYPALRIRMVAPSGSITNIHLNPATTTTTRRPKSTTTRRPTTTKTRRTRKAKNNYDSCVNACRGKSPICASPLSQTPIDPEKLKGFSSVCHMACHNSFRNEQYEMLVDGRCGNLRTRIKTADNNKVKRVELKKTQYTLVNDPQTIVEISQQQ